MNLFAVTVWTTATVPLVGHLFCLWKIRRGAGESRKTSAMLGIGLGLLIVAANVAALTIKRPPQEAGSPFSPLSVALAVGAAIVSIFAIASMRRSGDFDVQSIGIPCIVLSLFSMASVVALGAMTIAG